MFRKFLLPLLALVGVGFAIFTVKAGNKPVPVSKPVAEPALSPFPAYVAGSGLIEAATENIAVGTHVAGVVTKVHAQVGDTVKVDQPMVAVEKASGAVASRAPSVPKPICRPVSVAKRSGGNRRA